MQSRELILGQRNQITLPSEYIPAGVKLFRCEKQEDGSIRLIPEITIPYHQAYFWSKRWQAGEMKASKDAQSGRVRRHANAQALIQSLEQKRKK